MIYAIRAKRTAYVKIGYAVDSRKRLEGLQTGCPHELELEWELEGPQSAEQELHKKLAAYRHRGEWFRIGAAQLEKEMGFGKKPAKPREPVLLTELVQTSIFNELSRILFHVVQPWIDKAVTEGVTIGINWRQSEDSAATTQLLAEQLSVKLAKEYDILKRRAERSYQHRIGKLEKEREEYEQAIQEYERKLRVWKEDNP